MPRDVAYQIALSYAGVDGSSSDVGEKLASVSPINVNMQDFPPLLVEIGGSECLHDQIRRLVVVGRESGVEIEEHVSDGMVHVFPLFADFAKSDAAPTMAYERAAAFVDRVLGASSVVEVGALMVGGEKKEEEERFETGCDKV